ncbi:MAG: HigA family addiction module antitoxin [Rhodospirillaceae bacterium]
MTDAPTKHPGKVLYEQVMTPLGVSRNKLARDIDVPVGRISDIVAGKRGITPDTALRLAKYFGTTPDLWLRLQADYDLSVAAATTWPAAEPKVAVFQPMASPAADPAQPGIRTAPAQPSAPLPSSSPASSSPLSVSASAAPASVQELRSAIAPASRPVSTFAPGQDADETGGSDEEEDDDAEDIDIPDPVPPAAATGGGAH